MKSYLAILAAAASYFHISAAQLCTPGGLLGIGDEETTYPPDYQFVLYARAANGSMLGITAADTGDYAPLTVGTDSGPNALPQFVLVNGSVRTYDEPYRYMTTQASPLLNATQLFTSPEGVGEVASVVADNVTCSGGSSNAIRFEGLGILSTGSGSVDGPFATGSFITTPILDPVLPLSLVNAIDLILVFY